MAREISSSDREAGIAIWELARNKYRTKAAFADALSVSAQHLNSYLSGAKRPGILFLKRLVDLGFDVSNIPGAEAAKPYISPSPIIPGFASALADAMEAMRRTPKSLSRSLNVAPAVIEEWLRGEGQPGYDALGKLFTMTAEVSLRNCALAEPSKDLRQAGGKDAA